MTVAAGTWPALERRLEGQLVAMEPLAPEHEADLFAAGSDERVWRWIDEYVAVSRERFHDWMTEALEVSAAGVECALATVDLASGRAIGSSRYLAPSEPDLKVEIGWTWLTPAAWRGGANVEAKLLMLTHAFEELGCRRVEFKTDARNERSRGALAALPAQFEGIFRKHKIVRGVGERDSAYYSVIDDEWPVVKANLERRLSHA
ncbi:MAG TPA: GNAT family protein [Thermoleophilaceae bacterium]